MATVSRKFWDTAEFKSRADARDVRRFMNRKMEKVRQEQADRNRVNRDAARADKDRERAEREQELEASGVIV